MSVKELREKLENLPDDMPVAVEVEDKIRIAFGYEEKAPYWGSPGQKAPVLVIRG